MAATDAGLGLSWGSWSGVGTGPTGSTAAPFLHFMLTDWFSPYINNAKNNSATLLSLIPASSRYVSGKYVIEPVKYGRNHKAFNSVAEGGRFPDPGQTQARVYSYRTRTQFVRFIIQGFLMRAAQKDETRYVDPIVDLMSDFMDDYMVDTARKLYSDGSGRLCELDATLPTGFTVGSTAQTFTVRVNQDIATGQNAAGASATGASDQPPTMYLEPGMRVMVVTAGGDYTIAILTIVSITSATQFTATLDAMGECSGGTNINHAVGLAVGNWIVKCGTDDFLMTSTYGAMSAANLLAAKRSSAFRTEPVGLGGILGERGILDGNGPAKEVGATNLSTGESSNEAYTWSGTDDSYVTTATTNPYYFQGIPAHPSAGGWDGGCSFNQGIVLHNSGVKRSPSEQAIMRALSTIRKTNNAKVNLFLSSYEVRDTYAETLIGEKRYVNTVDLKGGWDPALVGPGGIPWAVDRLCWHNRLYMLALEDGGFMQHVLEPLSWATEQGAPIWTYLQDDDLYQGRMVEAYNVGVGVRNRCGGVMLDLLEA